MGNLKLPKAYICTAKDKGRLKIFRGSESGKRRVYLNNEDQFVIELFNPVNATYVAKIEINGELISSSGIVIKNGERIYLERFIDENKSFIFNTYLVEDNNEEVEKAIEDNGVVKIYFYHARKKRLNFTNKDLNKTSPYGGDPFLGRDLSYGNWNVTCNMGNISDNQPTYDTLNTSGLNLNSSSKRKFKETGKVEGGNKTEQDFKNVDIEYDSIPTEVVTFHITPKSVQNKESKDLKKDDNEYNFDVIYERLNMLKELQANNLITTEIYQKKLEEYQELLLKS